MKVVLATKNAGKAAEIREILSSTGLEFLTLDDFSNIGLPPETGDTFRENAAAKARFVAQKTGLLALADDSGLEVAVLRGRPGVLSARYSGPESTDEKNIEKLIHELKDVPEYKRQARFVCVIAFASPGGKVRTFEGRLDGFIAQTPSGKEGFGYDPVFFAPTLNKTLAEAPMAEKNKISHRKEALEKLRTWIFGKGGLTENF
ncbi:MAG: XTP/dITP diphosphatase [Deltaproteobacteria bacterium]|nr:XTP/dITP diphosphatase [Deltaproteobacteria bacterium]